jgi:hypothetical protein
MELRATQRAAILVFAVAFVVYVFPIVYDLGYKPFFNYTAGQDVASTSMLPVRLLQYGDFLLDEYQSFFKQNWISPGMIAQVNGHIVSRSPVGAAVLAIPFYGIPLGTGWIANPPQPWLSYPWSAFFPGKFAAAFMSACAVVMFFFCARELTDVRASAALAWVFAFGTSLWSTATQGLWQQTPSVFLQTIALWFILRGRRAGAAAIVPAAFFLSAATISRPNNALPALLFTVYLLIEYRSAFPRWVLWAIPPALFFLAYNAIYNGSPFVFGYQEGFQADMTAPQLDGILGLVFSPSRGLLVYSPFFAFALVGAWLARHESARRFYLFAGLNILLGTVLISMFIPWDAGWGYGTRYMTDLLPYLMLFLVPVFKRLRGWGLGAFLVMAVYAGIVQGFGLWDYGERWHWHWANYRYDVWNVPENEPLFYLKQYVAMARYFLSR